MIKFKLAIYLPYSLPMDTGAWIHTRIDGTDTFTHVGKTEYTRLPRLKCLKRLKFTERRFFAVAVYMRQLDEIDARYDAAIPDDKVILTAAKQILHIHEGDVTDAKLHAARFADEFLEKGDIDGHLTWLKLHRAIIELTDEEWDGETVH